VGIDDSPGFDAPARRFLLTPPSTCVFMSTKPVPEAGLIMRVGFEAREEDRRIGSDQHDHTE
jgi:hypothetical protein